MEKLWRAGDRVGVVGWPGTLLLPNFSFRQQIFSCPSCADVQRFWPVVHNKAVRIALIYLAASSEFCRRQGAIILAQKLLKWVDGDMISSLDKACNAPNSATIRHTLEAGAGLECC